MIKLTEATIEKYKCYVSKQTITIDPSVTVLVGMNEAGKTALLEALAKTNYFIDDPEYKFDPVYDYPRKEKKAFDKAEIDPVVVMCNYQIDDALIRKINEDLGVDIFHTKSVSYSEKYSNEGQFDGVSVSTEEFMRAHLKKAGLGSSPVVTEIEAIQKLESFASLKFSAEQIKERELSESLKKYFKNEWKWDNPVGEYVARVWIKPHLPKFLYYSEYYSLPSRVNLRDLSSNKLSTEAQKTSKALLELADVDMDQLMSADNYEAFVAELEATSNIITETMFKYWKTNQDLRIRFHIDRQYAGNQLQPYLEIRVENLKHAITLPLESRSKGFNWFFSFIVWFSKIQEDKTSDYVLLLDEPGLNLHAAAQFDLLSFVEDLSKDYQVVYTTHSPFMIETSRLNRVRTIFETRDGTKLSDGVYEKDPNTLFPLQAALGYDIAQNLFIGKNNLVVEGPADLAYLMYASGILEEQKRERLRKDITIVPIGGADKVVSFVALFKGNALNVVCLLDTFRDEKGRQRLDDLVKQKIIRERNVRFYHEFRADRKGEITDIEDLFSPEEYLKMFTLAFPNTRLSLDQLPADDPSILLRISNALNIKEFNHYKVANALLTIPFKDQLISEDTLSRFETMFKEINKLFPKGE